MASGRVISHEGDEPPHPVAAGKEWTEGAETRLHGTSGDVRFLGVFQGAMEMHHYLEWVSAQPLATDCLAH